jgi:hypothetical protein
MHFIFNRVFILNNLIEQLLGRVFQRLGKSADQIKYTGFKINRRGFLILFFRKDNRLTGLRPFKYVPLGDLPQP